MKTVIEVCAESYQDCMAAYYGGADRVVLSSAMSVGGLTPSLASLRAIKRDMDIQVICTVRPRAAGFYYDECDFEIMMEEAKSLLEAGADGISFGFLNRQGQIHEEYTKKMVNLIHSYHKEAVYHRAFDVCLDPYQAIEDLIRYGVDRVMTSGQKEQAWQGRKLIQDLQRLYGDRIQIIASCGINAKNVREFLEYTGIHQINSYCAGYMKDPTTLKNDVSYSYLSGKHLWDYNVVCEGRVMELVNTID